MTLRGGTLGQGVWVVIAFLAILAGGLIGSAAHAHDARMLSVIVDEIERDIYRVALSVPPSVAATNQPGVEWPRECEQSDEPSLQSRRSGARRIIVQCAGGLNGARIGIRYPRFNPSISTLIRFTPIGGETTTAVLPPERSEWTVAGGGDWRSVAKEYLTLGVMHILTGIDHLLFVAGLMLLAGTGRRILIAITGFTVAHSITLSLSALGLVRLPIAPTEAAIALSILLVAREIVRSDSASLARRFPVAVAFSFGLLHGFGFAAALMETGLPSGALAGALLSFNLGVELGQLAFIAVVVGLVRTSSGITNRFAQGDIFRTGRWQYQAASYGLGVPAAFWFCDRLLSFPSG